jgi:hypothetical protein
MRSFSATCEVWVKPLYKKSRPKNLTTTWCADSYEEMLGLLKAFYDGKRWKLLDWKEFTNSKSVEG